MTKRRNPANPYYRGPPSDHFDGRLFFNPEGRGAGRLRRSPALAVRRRAGANGRRPGRARFRRPSPSARVDGDGAARHHGRPRVAADADRRAQYPDRPGLVGPRLAASPSPGRAGSTRPASPSRTCRRSTSSWSATITTTISTSHAEAAAGSARSAGRHAARQRRDHPRRRARHATSSAHDWGDARRRRQPASRVHVEPAHHWSARGMRDRRMALWGGFVIETPAGKIYLRRRHRLSRRQQLPRGGRATRRLPPRHPADRRL